MGQFATFFFQFTKIKQKIELHNKCRDKFKHKTGSKYL